MSPTADMQHLLPESLSAYFRHASLPRSIQGLQTWPATAAWPAQQDSNAGLLPSAVAFLFIPPAMPTAPARIVLTRRSTAVRSHRRQIGFAGGRAEHGDASPLATALRELDEELGVSAATALGVLPEVRGIDGAAIVPVIIISAVDVAAMRPQSSEVEAVFAVPWPALSASRSAAFRFNIFGHWRTSQLFQWEGCQVWGLTAQIIFAAGLA